jgi:hypothetical protein
VLQGTQVQVHPAARREQREALAPGGQPMPRNWRLVFVVLTILGMILIAISLLLLLRKGNAGEVANACFWM